MLTGERIPGSDVSDEGFAHSFMDVRRGVILSIVSRVGCHRTGNVRVGQ